MNPRATCLRCGTRGAAGEPSLCDSCFKYFFRHDPGSPYYCGGCQDCGRVLREEHQLGRHQIPLALGAGA